MVSGCGYSTQGSISSRVGRGRRWTREVPEPADYGLWVLASGAGLKEPGGSQGPCRGQWVGGHPGRELGSGWEEGRRGAWNAVKPLTPIPASGNQSTDQLPGMARSGGA